MPTPPCRVEDRFEIWERLGAAGEVVTPLDAAQAVTPAGRTHMNDGFYDESDFFFLCRGTPGKLDAFVTRFALRLNPHSDALDLLSSRHASQSVQAAWLKHLDVSWQIGADLHLLDPSGQHFMICLRPEEHIVFGFPYTLLDGQDMLVLLRQFDIICGWGWSHEPPPQSIADIKACAQRSSPVYRRYFRGIMIQVDN